jgi:hypothetical protein
MGCCDGVILPSHHCGLGPVVLSPADSDVDQSVGVRLPSQHCGLGPVVLSPADSDVDQSVDSGTLTLCR